MQVRLFFKKTSTELLTFTFQEYNIESETNIFRSEYQFTFAVCTQDIYKKSVPVLSLLW